ncbi:hypothetical protein [Streptomyces sp. Rer75]|uniref:hypothetical protein n=1 Tax=Streptomyces sp. Rer75 TaxID=2750011 RepID=UPI0015D01784|nr:hypothetical protein [Streptomyces sp. Rer75]QLH19366.1 hypothetical protein HYQ63_00595 [Streptomyces sp. Rer75]
MDITKLASAYSELLTAAEAITPDTALVPETRADVDWRLCHIALADEIIANAARDQITGYPPVIDNQPSMDPYRITSTISATSHPQRVDSVRRNWVELQSILTIFTALDADAQLKLRIHDRDGAYMNDSTMTWSALIGLRASQHIPGHRDALVQALARH